MQVNARKARAEGLVLGSRAISKAKANSAATAERETKDAVERKLANVLEQPLCHGPTDVVTSRGC